MVEDPIQYRLPDECFCIVREDQIGVPEVQEMQIIRQELNRQLFDIPARGKRGRVRLWRRPARCTYGEDGNGNVSEMVIERYVNLIASRRIEVDVRLPGHVGRNGFEQIHP